MERRTERKLAGMLRAALVVTVIVLQLALILLLAVFLQSSAIYVYLIFEILALIEIIALMSRDQNSSFTIAWILVIAFLPVFGQVLYMLWGRSGYSGPHMRKIRASASRVSAYLVGDEAADAELCGAYPEHRGETTYLRRMGFPLYRGTSCKYYTLGELQYDAMLEDMERAERFIFISTFILDTGELWDRVRGVLIKKAEQGVDVRLLFDDFGSILTAPDNIIKDLGKHGVRAARFNPIHRFISRLYINYRSHQKICAIDGSIAYTGGSNLADEYANLYPKHGHWKDTGIRLEGDAVWTLTLTFLQMWDGQTGDVSDLEACRPAAKAEDGGFFQPFFDGPDNNPENPAETMYRKLISSAGEYLYITTPYLVIDSSMIEQLCTAAVSGVDVRIVTPKIWDHWYTHLVTQSNYRPLLKAGVKIYEYTPGYIHAKTILCDGSHCVTGSINMDYRSFHLHFENGVWICGDPVLGEIERDMLATFELSEEISLEEYERRPVLHRMLAAVLRVFAVLL